MSDINNLITKISTLSLRQQCIIKDVVDEISQEENAEASGNRRGTQLGANQGVRLLPRVPNSKFVSKNHIPLAVGDRVEILTTRRVGRSGDIAEVEVFNKLYMGIRLLENGASGQRAAKYLRFIK